MPDKVRLLLILCARSGFRGGTRFLMFLVHCNSFTLAMFGREIRHFSGVSWLVSFLLELGGRSVAVLMLMVTCFGSAPSPPLVVDIRENPEFYDFMSMDKGHWHACSCMGCSLCCLVPTMLLLWLGLLLRVPVICWSVLLGLTPQVCPVE